MTISKWALVSQAGCSLIEQHDRNQEVAFREIPGNNYSMHEIIICKIPSSMELTQICSVNSKTPTSGFGPTDQFLGKAEGFRVKVQSG